MNPVLLSVGNIDWTETGRRILENLSDAFGCDIITFQPNRRVAWIMFKKALEKIEKFETIGDLDFTHLIIADYNIRLLEIAPLLPFYDIDPNKIQFVGTGVWDDRAFFNEPSLQRAIFPGVSIEKRQSFIDEYINAYNSQPKRIVTILYDLISLISYIVENQPNLESAFKFLNDQSLSFEGIDGKFSFENNLIKRKLDILQIIEGEALLIK